MRSVARRQSTSVGEFRGNRRTIFGVEVDVAGRRLRLDLEWFRRLLDARFGQCATKMEGQGTRKTDIDITYARLKGDDWRY